MKIEGEGQLLRIFIGESDHWEGRPLYQVIVRAAREHGLAGATVLRGLEGFGANSRIHTVKILRLSEDLPIVVEMVDRPERIAAFLPTLDKMVGEGMVTLEKVNVLMYRHSDNPLQANEDMRLETRDFSPSTGPPDLFAQSTNRARQIIALAKAEATRSHRGFVDSVDVLLAMLHEQGGIAGQVLRDLQISPDTVERSLREQVSRETPTDAYLEALDAKSVAEANWLGHNFPGTEHLLLALCEIRPSAATDILMRLGAQPREICEDVLDILGRHDDWQHWLADHPNM